jgi:hypothetical protein
MLGDCPGLVFNAVLHPPLQVSDKPFLIIKTIAVAFTVAQFYGSKKLL